VPGHPRVGIILVVDDQEGVRALLIDGWRDFEVISDLAGWPRVIGCSV